MGLIDFKEIPQANIANGYQDTYELFAREFFEGLRFKIDVNPDRGQDGGRDLIIIENRLGILDTTHIRWLVSCKHMAHSGSSVKCSDEEDISDRIKMHNCQGFIGFYSTIVSAPLGRKLEGLKKDFEIQIFDNEKIERILLESIILEPLISRFFPISYNKHSLKEPSNLLTEYVPLKCNKCGRDLLHRNVLEDYDGVVVFVEDIEFYESNYPKTKFVDIYCACKGTCDEDLEDYHFKLGHTNGWEDISDLIIPYKFLQFLMSIMNRIRAEEDIYTDEAFEKLKDFIIALSQIVMKNQSEEDIKRIQELQMLPEWL